VAILLSVDDYTFLARSQIQKLHFGEQSPFGGWTAGSYRACRRLRQLYDHRYLDRLWAPRTAFGLPDPLDAPLAITGSPPALYRLGAAGIPVVAREREEDFKVVAKRSRIRPKPTILAHEVLLNELRLQLALQTAAAPHIRLERWETGATCFVRYAAGESDGRARTRVFNPDGFFRLHVGAGVLAVFVEVDLGTESVTRRFRAKIHAYRTYARSGEYLARFGQKRFRVLVLTTSAARVTNLAKLAEEEQACHVFWFTTCDALLSAHNFLTEPLWQRAGKTKPAVFLDSVVAGAEVVATG
jgi:hypothetical protein